MNNLSGISYTSNIASLDGLSIVQADAIYVDGSDIDPGSYVKKSGDTMSGTLNMGTNSVTSSHAPTIPTDLTNKAYVDSTIAGSGYVPYTGATSSVNLNTQAISAGNATFSGTIINSGIASGTPSFTVGVNGSNQLIKYANPTGAFTGSVSATKIPYASSANVLADSLLSQSGSTVTNIGNEIVIGTVDLTGGSITTSKTNTGWGVPYFTTTGSNNVLNYTYASGQGVITSTASATSMAVYATGITVSGSYQMVITGFKTSTSLTSVSINIRQGSTYAGSTIIQTISISTPTVAQDLTFNFSTTPAYGVNFMFEVIAYAGSGSSSLAYFNTITLNQLSNQLLQTNVAGKLNAFKGVDVTGGLTNNGNMTNTGIASVGELAMSGLTIGASGLASELTNIINFGLNFRGTGVVNSNLGGALRIDGRSGQPLFTWFYRPASGTEGGIATLTSGGSFTANQIASSGGDVLVGKDFYIGANSSAWNTTYGKGLYVRYSTNGGQDSTYIQSIDRSTNTAYPMELEASKFNFAVGNVGIGNKVPGYKLDVNGNANIGTSMSVGTSLSTGTSISAGSSITAGTTIQSGTSVTDGSISLFAKNGQATQTYEFYVGGANRDTFCPVFINTDNAWSNANVALFEIGRSSVHTDGSGLGAFQYIYQGHNSNWGHGAEYIYHKYRGSPGWTYTRFIADIVQDGTTTVVVVWLRANLTYYFSSRNGCYVSFFPKTTTPYPIYTGGGNNAPYYTKSSLVGIFNALTFAYDSRTDQTTMDSTNYFSTIQPNRIVDSYTKVVRQANANWGGGYWIYNAFFRASTSSTVTISGSVSGYVSSGGAVTVGIGVQPANNSYFAQIWGVSPYVNNVYNHMPFPFTANYNTPFSTDGSTGWYHLYFWNAYGIITDGNDYVNADVTVTMHTP